jgi:hypothetical protein
VEEDIMLTHEEMVRDQPWYGYRDYPMDLGGKMKSINPYVPGTKSYAAHEACQYLYDTDYTGYMDCYYEHLKPGGAAEARELYPEQYRKAEVGEKPDPAGNIFSKVWFWIIIGLVIAGIVVAGFLFRRK